MSKIIPRDPFLALASSDPIVPELCKLLAALGYDVGPLGPADVSVQVLAAVQQFRAEVGVAEDPADLPAETEPDSCIGPATWAALHEAARAGYLHGIGHPDVGQVDVKAKRAAAAAEAKRGRGGRRRRS